jgi:DNA-binding CsgD family transcriptional regulator
MILDQSVVCPVFIGRQNDLQLLDRLMVQLGNRHGQVALISGEAGIGKSRLVKEAKARAPEGVMILEGHCFQTESALPYAPLLDLFRNYFGIHSREEIAQAVGPSAPQLVKLFPELAVHLPHQTSTPDSDPKQEKRNLFQALSRTLTDLAQNGPLIVVVEDLHWSDSTSLEFLLQLARRIPSQPILLLVTYRSDETTPELTYFLAELDRERLGVEFALKPMSQPEVESMLRAILDLKTPISQGFLDTIFPLTEGNPFFVEEILKSLIADGDIFYADGTWDRKDISQLHIPRTIQDVVQRRAQLLDEPTLQALTLAAVMGRRFDFGLLQEMLGVNEGELMAMLKNLIKAQLVVEETADQFAFRHALTREAVYATLLLRERQRLHRQVGEAIERLYADSLNSHLADLSYHYYTSGVWGKALEYSQKAGDQARTLYAQQEAIAYYTRALASAHQLRRVVEPELLGARGHAYEILGDFKSALDDFEAALRIAREQQDGHAEWQTLIDLGFLWAGRDYQQTGDYFRRAEELARKLNESKLRAHSLNRLGNWYVNIGQTSQGLKDHYRALEIFEEVQDEEGTANTHDLLGMASMQHGDQIGSFDEYQYAIQLFRKMDNKHGLVSALVGACNASYWNDTVFMPSQSRTENHQMAIEALELARQIGWAADQAFAEWGIAVGLANRGLVGEALTHASESLRIATEIEHRQWIAAAYYTLGHIYVLMLQSDLAIQNLKQSLILAAELGSAWWTGNILTDLVNAYLLNDDIGQARAILGSAPLKADGFRTLVERRMLWAQGNLLLAEDEPAEALRIAEGLLSSISNGNPTQPIPALLKLKGEALMALGQWQAAEGALEAAKAGAEQREALPLLWQIHCLSGWLHQEQKDQGGADKEFASARRVIERLGTNIEEERLREEFILSACKTLPREKTLTKRQSEAEKFAGLTPREREVAYFLAQGKSNREIADELVLSERTVENHVGNILTKLGFDSRAQIAVWAVEKGLGKEKS